MKHSPEFTDIILSLDELVSACGQERQWVIELLEENIIEYDVPERQQFTGYQLTTVRVPRDSAATLKPACRRLV